jgi:hypothetical protein
MLYSDGSSEDEQLLIRPFLRKTKNTKHGRRVNIKININFMETTREVLHLDK